jgi:hypothetical protein
MNEVNLLVVARRHERLGEVLRALGRTGGRVIGQVWEDHEGGPIVLHVTMPESDWGAIVTAAEDRLDLLPFDWRDHATLRRPDD